MTVTKQIFSGSTDGEGIKVVATTSTGTTIHTVSSTATDFDEIWLWATNNHTTDVLLTVEWGVTTAPDGNIILTIPMHRGLVLVAPGLSLKGNASPHIVTAFAGITNVISIHGFVNRISA